MWGRSTLRVRKQRGIDLVLQLMCRATIRWAVLRVPARRVRREPVWIAVV
jgi:hypothetical protein